MTVAQNNPEVKIYVGDINSSETLSPMDGWHATINNETTLRVWGSDYDGFVDYFISDMTKTAHNIAIENMDSRIETPPVEDELTELAKTFNSMLDRLQAGIAQQQRFVSDASHELRTPATVIRGYSDLLSRCCCQRF